MSPSVFSVPGPCAGLNANLYGALSAGGGTATSTSLRVNHNTPGKFHLLQNTFLRTMNFFIGREGTRFFVNALLKSHWIQICVETLQCYNRIYSCDTLNSAFINCFNSQRKWWVTTANFSPCSDFLQDLGVDLFPQV